MFSVFHSGQMDVRTGRFWLDAVFLILQFGCNLLLDLSKCFEDDLHESRYCKCWESPVCGDPLRFGLPSLNWSGKNCNRLILSMTLIHHLQSNTKIKEKGGGTRHKDKDNGFPLKTPFFFSGFAAPCGRRRRPLYMFFFSLDKAHLSPVNYNLRRFLKFIYICQ